MTPTKALTKSIAFDPITKDYRMELDGLLVGYAACYHEAERVLNETAYEWLTHGYAATATELDGAQADDEPEPEPVNWTDRDPDARQCPNCGDAHHVQLCPEIRAALIAPAEQPWKDIALGRELCRMNWRDHQRFVALLSSLPSAHLVDYAESYIAFIRDYNPASALTIDKVIAVWVRDIRRAHTPALEKAA